jgi:hypothetical protein
MFLISSQVKKSGQCQLRDKKHQYFSIVSLPTDSVIVDHAVLPCEQQLLFELAINSGDFYVMFQREIHFINNRLQKPKRLNLKCMPAVNNVNKTNRNRYNSQS